MSDKSSDFLDLYGFGNLFVDSADAAKNVADFMGGMSMDPAYRDLYTVPSDLFSQSFASATPSGGSWLDDLSATLKPYSAFFKENEPLMKWGGSALGGLAGYLSAKKYNKLAKQQRDEMTARLAQKDAQAQALGAPVNYTLMRALNPQTSGAGGEARFFTNNALSANPGVVAPGYAEGGYFSGGTKGQDDKVPAMLSDGEFVMDAETVSMLGDGNNAAGASALEQMRQNIRKHKRSAPASKIPPKSKKPEQYMKKGNK